MKKLLTAIAAIGIAATGTSSLVSCGKTHGVQKKEGENKKEKTPATGKQNGSKKDVSTKSQVLNSSKK